MDRDNLIRRAKDGNSASWTKIYARHQPALYRYVFYRVGEAGAAEDLTGEVFVRLAKGSDRLPCRDDTLLARLYTIAQNLLLDMPAPADTPAADTPDSQKAGGQRPTPRHLITALAHLPDDQRQIILLKFVEGLDDETVARILGRPADAIQSLQGQALTTLSTAWHTAARHLQHARHQELERLRAEFRQSVAHELRTPLTLIRGYSDLLLSGAMGDIPPKQQEALEAIYDRSEELSSVIHNLTFSRAIPKETLKLTSLPVPEWVEGALDRFRRAAEQAGVRFEVDLPDDLPPILGDQIRLGVALSRLLDNAIKFSPDGGLVHVRVWLDEGWLHVAVQDQGVGIAPERLDGIFDSFSQVDRSTTRRFGGVGMGLTVVRAVVEAHGGRVWAASEGPGRGSTFTVALPVGSAENPPPSRLPAPKRHRTPGQELNQALEASLSLVEEGRATVEECLARHPEYAADLHPLLKIALEVRRAPRAAPSQAAFAAGERRLLETLAEKERGRAVSSSSQLARLVEGTTVAIGRLKSLTVPMRAFARRTSVRRTSVRPTFVLRPALMAALALILLVFGTPFLQVWSGGYIARSGTLAQANGTVEVLPVGDETWRFLSVGDRIEAGDRIRTGQLSAARLIFFDESTTDLGSEAEITVAQMSSRRDGSGRLIVLHQWLGQTYNRVTHFTDAASHFRVETPTAVTVVRGTEFAITIEADGATHVTVIKGEVNVTAENATVAVPAGQETRVLPDHAPLAAYPIRTVAPTPLSVSSFPRPTGEASRQEQAAEPTGAPEPEEAVEQTQTPTPVPTEAPRPTNTPEPTLAPTSKPTSTPYPPTQVPAPTNVPAPPTPLPSPTPTLRPTLTPIPTATPMPTATSTPMPTATPTSTPMPTATSTSTPMPTATLTSTPEMTSTSTVTSTNTPPPTATYTPMPTDTPEP